MSPKNLYVTHSITQAQIFAVKQSNENTRSDKLVLIDVGIRGESKIEMIEGQIYFSGLKFSSTTYNNEGMRFKLIIVLFIEEDEN